MKRYVKATTSDEIIKLEVILRKAVREAASYLYNTAPLGDDDPRADYFADNIFKDSDVLEARDHLQSALLKAYDRQMKR